MKIAFIGQKGIPMKFGGVEKHVERLATGLAEKGHKVFAYTRPWYTPKSLKYYKSVKLISLKSIKTKNLDAISHTWRASWHAVKSGYDIVHYHGVGPALLAWIPRLFARKTKVVITFHCLDRYHQKWSLLARLALRLGEWAAVKFAHETITVSKTLQLYCQDKFHEKTTYIPNGIDLPKKQSADLIKKKFGLKKNGYIFFISRLVKHKGVHYLIKAYNQLKTDKKLVIVGASAFTDPYVKKIKAQAKDNPNIIFTGNIKGGSQLWRELYSNAYMMVHPSESEGLPIVILEGMSFGLPVLASDIPENMEAVAGGYGFSFKNKSVGDLKNKMDYLLGCPDLVKQVGKDARKHVRENYNWKDIVISVQQVYHNLVVDFASARQKSKQTECIHC
ncbi:MAG TPA: glycosyltransferase family 4 protein [Patescibacteria group bacterium]|nr:glycosyltransferase family 4 protein [Patescibacteria group bacterium]